jgi:hypothetical protein
MAIVYVHNPVVELKVRKVGDAKFDLPRSGSRYEGPPQAIPLGYMIGEFGVVVMFAVGSARINQNGSKIATTAIVMTIRDSVNLRNF